MQDYELKLDAISEMEVYQSNLSRIKDINFDQLVHRFVDNLILQHMVVMPPIPSAVSNQESQAAYNNTL